MSMKVFCISTKRNWDILRPADASAKLDLALLHGRLEYYDKTRSPSEIMRARLTHKNIEKFFHQEDVGELLQEARAFAPERILIINPNFDAEEICAFQTIAPLSVWFIDSVVNLSDAKRFQTVDVFAYDQESVRYLKSQGVAAGYVPVGYNPAYDKARPIAKDIDLSFVGTPYKHRLKILERVARIAKEKGWNFKVYAPIFNPGLKNFLKQISFRLRYPNLAGCITNGALNPQAVADIYARSKICLNIHDNFNRGVNPRSFEILATGSFQLMDEREYYDILAPGEDLATYRDENELMEKIVYYLLNEEERNRIALNGKQKVIGKRTMENSLRQILGFSS